MPPNLKALFIIDKIESFIINILIWPIFAVILLLLLYVLKLVIIFEFEDFSFLLLVFELELLH